LLWRCDLTSIATSDQAKQRRLEVGIDGKAVAGGGALAGGLGHDAGLLVVADALLEEVGLALCHITNIKHS